MLRKCSNLYERHALLWAITSAYTFKYSRLSIAKICLMYIEASCIPKPTFAVNKVHDLNCQCLLLTLHVKIGFSQSPSQGLFSFGIQIFGEYGCDLKKKKAMWS